MRRNAFPASVHSTFLFFHLYPPFQPLSLNVVREVAAYLSTYRYFPAIAKAHLLVYDLEIGSKAVLPLIQDFPTSARLCLISEWTGLIFGSRTSRAVQHIDLRDCQLIATAPMLELREDSGAIGYKGDCYLFGGRGDRKFLKTAEKLGKASEQWSYIAEMASPGFTFTPCLHHHSIYLPIANSRGKDLQSYHPSTNTYQTHALRLCQPGNSSVSAIFNGELVIITGNSTVGKWTLGSERTETELISSKMEFVNGVEAVTFPVVKGCFLYWADQDRHLAKFDLRSCTFPTLPDFSHSKKRR